MSIADLYNKTAGLYSSVHSSQDEFGGDVRTVALRESVPCYFTPLSARDTLAYGKRDIDATHRLFCACRDVSSTDLWLIDGKWFSTVFPEDACNRGHHMEVVLSRTEAPEIVECSSSSSESSSSDSSSSP
jgi:hypothetical protein